jgi:hypothetical protein
LLNAFTTFAADCPEFPAVSGGTLAVEDAAVVAPVCVATLGAPVTVPPVPLAAAGELAAAAGTGCNATGVTTTGTGGDALPAAGKFPPESESSDDLDEADLRAGFEFAFLRAPAKVVPSPPELVGFAAAAPADVDGLISGWPEGCNTRFDAFMAEEIASCVPFFADVRIAANTRGLKQMKLTGIDTIAVPVSDTTVAKLFYTEKLQRNEPMR